MLTLGLLSGAVDAAEAFKEAEPRGRLQVAGVYHLEGLVDSVSFSLSYLGHVIISFYGVLPHTAEASSPWASLIRPDTSQTWVPTETWFSLFTNFYRVFVTEIESWLIQWWCQRVGAEGRRTV